MWYEGVICGMRYSEGVMCGMRGMRVLCVV